MLKVDCLHVCVQELQAAQNEILRKNAEHKIVVQNLQAELTKAFIQIDELEKEIDNKAASNPAQNAAAAVRPA